MFDGIRQWSLVPWPGCSACLPTLVGGLTLNGYVYVGFTQARAMDIHIEPLSAYPHLAVATFCVALLPTCWLVLAFGHQWAMWPWRIVSCFLFLCHLFLPSPQGFTVVLNSVTSVMVPPLTGWRCFG